MYDYAIILSILISEIRVYENNKKYHDYINPIYIIMRSTLLYTTMTNHRPVVYTIGGDSSSSSAETRSAPQQFRATAARDPNDPNPNVPAQPVLRDMLARSTQPIFSVSAMFRMKAGGGCGSCGH